MQIETLFKGLKSSGLNLEETLMIHIQIEEAGHADNDYICMVLPRSRPYYAHIERFMIKRHGRRAVSVFKCGLDYFSRRLLSGTNRYNLELKKILSYT